MAGAVLFQLMLRASIYESLSYFFGNSSELILLKQPWPTSTLMDVGTSRPIGGAEFIEDPIAIRIEQICQPRGTTYQKLGFCTEPYALHA
jgi:hypothetical protein